MTFKTENTHFPYQENLGLKIGRFSCMTQPRETAYKSGINEPTFTKFGS